MKYDPIAALTTVLESQTAYALKDYAAGDLIAYAARLLTIERVAAAIRDLITSQEEPNK